MQHFLINKFITIRFINPFHATGLFRKPLKTSENLWFSDVFRGYQKRPVAWNGLITRAWDCFVVIAWMKMGSTPRVITLMPCTIWYHLHNLKNVKNTRERVLTLLLKVIFLHGCFTCFLNCTNVTKSRKASQIEG